MQFSVAILSVLAICDQDNIADQLGVSLAFFFILEVDEWIFDAFIRDFDVIEDEDFIMKSVDIIKAYDIQTYYRKKSLVGFGWGFLLTLLSVFVVLYFYLTH